MKSVNRITIHGNVDPAMSSKKSPLEARHCDKSGMDRQKGAKKEVTD